MNATMRVMLSICFWMGESPCDDRLRETRDRAELRVHTGGEHEGAAAAVRD